jgi:hypothetical protein
MAGAAVPWTAGCDELLGVQEAQVTGADGGGAKPGAPVILARGLSDPLGIALDETHVYWVEGDGFDGGPGSVSVMLKGGGGAKLVADEQPSPLDIAVDDTGIYWSVNTVGLPADPQCMVRMKRSPTSPEECVTTSTFTTTRMTLTSSYVVVLTTDSDNNSHLGFVSKTGEPAVYNPVPAASPARALAATDAIALIGDGAHVDDYGLPALGMGMAVYQGPGPWQVADITVDSVGDAFWAASDGVAGQVASGSYNKLDTAETVLASKLPGTPQRIAVGGAYVYVTLIAGPTSGVVAAVEQTGALARQLAILDDCAPYGIAVDATRVYWTCTGTNGSIQSIAVPPTPP